MSHTIILNTLTNKKLLIPADAQALGSLTGRAFLSRAIQVYENKVNLYLNTCKNPVERASGNMEAIIDSAYNAFLNFEKWALVPSLKLLLKRVSPDLIPSLGLSGASSKDLFIHYVARYALFCAVNTDSLSRLCQEAEGEAPLLFPSFLLDALKLEKYLSDNLKTALAGRQPGESARIRAQFIPLHQEEITANLKGIIFYFGKVISSNPLQPNGFEHLRSEETHREFVEAVAEGYISEMQKEENQQANMQASNLTSQIAQICLPAMALLGMSIQIDQSALNARQQEIQNALNQNAADSATRQQQIAQAGQNALGAIDAWRASIPKRPITFGVTVGMPM